MAEESMFGISNIFDAATADNVGIRDRALKVAQLQPGRASVYGASQAGGMLMQNLAGMAGMKTAQQEKADVITGIMKEAGNMDQSDPNTARTLANKFIQAGFPQIGQKFLDKARTMQVKNREMEQTDTGLELEAKKVDIMGQTETRLQGASDADTEIRREYLDMDWEKFEFTKFKDEKYIDIATNQDTRDQAKFDFDKAQTDILNAFRDREIDVNEMNSKLQANMFAFDKVRAEIKDEQWLAEHTEAKLMGESQRAVQLATKDGLVLENEAFTYNNNIRNANIEAQTANTELQTKLSERGLSMPPEGEFITVDNRLQRYNPDTNSYDDVTDPDLLETGEYGLSAEEGRVYDNIWDQYKQRFFIKDSFGDGSWKEDTPEFLDWAQKNVTGEQGLGIIIKGQGGTRGSYNNKLETDFNNSQIKGGDKVAATVTTVVDGVERQDVIVEPVNVKFLSDKMNVNQSEFSKIPAKVNGKPNTLTNGQIITKLLMEGNESEAVEFASNMEGQKVENTGREKQIDDTSKTTWTKVKISDSRYQTQRQQDQAKARGEIKKMGGVWYTTK